MSRLTELLEAAKREEMPTQVMVRVRPETHTVLKRLAKETGLSMTVLMHIAITLIDEEYRTKNE